MEKKKFMISVDAEIAEEIHEQVSNYISDFYGEEAKKIEVGELED